MLFRLPLVPCGQVMDSPVTTWFTAVLFLMSTLTFFLLNVLLVTTSVAWSRRRCRARTRLCRRVMQRCWVRRDAPLPGRTRECVRRRVVVRDHPVVEVEANRGQVRLLKRHKVRVVEVPAVDVPCERRLECELPIGTTAYSGLLYDLIHGLGTANGY